ncbi:MAG: hypothetical protein OXC26_02940 [Albidovulum sp.]|nr:hypothetical protein [Albidovulum sp.]
MREEFNLDALPVHALAELDPEARVVNPAWRELDRRPARGRAFRGSAGGRGGRDELRRACRRVGRRSFQRQYPRTRGRGLGRTHQALYNFMQTRGLKTSR